VAAALESRDRRGTQLALTILAILLSVGAYVLVALGQSGRTPKGVGGFVAAVAIAYLGVHLLTARLAPNADPVMLPIAAVLAGVGYAVVFRLDPHLAGAQFVWLMIGLLLFVVTLAVVRDHRSLDAYTYTIGLIGILFLLLPIAPGIGRTINGARLWVGIGPLSFQPSEIGKVLLVIFLASYLNSKKELLALATAGWDGAAIEATLVPAYPCSRNRLRAASTIRSRVRWACSARTTDRYPLDRLTGGAMKDTVTQY